MSSDRTPAYILGLATAFPDRLVTADEAEQFMRKWCAENEALEKTLFVNRNTKILTRPMIHEDEHTPEISGPRPPTIKAVNGLFMRKGVALALKAGERALKDWGGNKEDITHMVANTCTASSYPGFDYAVLMGLGLPLNTDRTLLHGVGCAGGMCALRLAHQLARQPPSYPGEKPRRILVVATEITSTLCRSEMEEMGKVDDGRPNVSVCLFSDGASAMIVGGGEPLENEHASFELIHAVTHTVPDSAEDLGFHVDEYGWKAVISQRVPRMTAEAVPISLNQLLTNPGLKTNKTVGGFLDASDPSATAANTLDWLIHPGGSLILSKIEASLKLSAKDHTRASWDVYTHKGNSSSVSIGAVFERSREMQSREGCIAVAFGPGVSVEMTLLRRTGWKGRQAEEQDGKVVESQPHVNGNGVAATVDASKIEQTMEKLAKGLTV